jgi:hypothetical protein
MPARTRSRIKSDSSSAIEAIRVRKSRPIAPLVSTFSRRDIKTTPRLSNSSHDLQEVLDAPRDPVECRHKHDGKLLSPGIPHEGIKTRTACLLPANAIFVFVYDLQASLCRQLSKIVQLRFDVLVGSRNANVDGCSQCVPPEGGLGRLAFCPLDILYEMRR